MPIKDVKASGEEYHIYWLDADFIKAWKERRLIITMNGVEVNPNLAI